MTSSKPKITPLEYAPMGTLSPIPAWSPLIPDERSAHDQAQLLARMKQLEAEKAEIMRVRELEIAAARAEGCELGKLQQHEQYSSSLEAARAALARAIQEFHGSRDHYFAKIEQEVVKLALAIAARILNREAQMDPLLLSGAVRVALGQLSESTDIRLHIPSAEEELWNEMLRLMPNLPSRPAIVSDDKLHAGECRLESHLGTVDLGVRAQLAEIERGFFDLLEHRTKAQHAAIA